MPSVPALILFALAGAGVAIMWLEALALWRVRRRILPEPPTYPAVSILKPLCGLDDELTLNLESHVTLDYPGEYEVLLGVRSTEDLAYPVAKAFAAAHPGRVRLVLQEGEPGHNPKVNQLIALTRAARHGIIACTDSNVRVHRHYLREVVGALAQPKIGLATHVFAGVGEKRFGAVLDNLTLALFCAPNMAVAYLYLGMEKIVGKSVAMPVAVLQDIGGWHSVKDVLAEDHELGMALQSKGYHMYLCPTPVQNIQVNQSFRQFWGRHTRWAMIRFRVIFPIVLGEPILNPIFLALIAALWTPSLPLGWGLFAAVAALTTAVTQVCTILARGHGFKPWHLLLVPLRDLIFFAAWVRGGTMRWVNWRGNRLLVLEKTRLAAPTALSRARNIQRLSR